MKLSDKGGCAKTIRSLQSNACRQNVNKDLMLEKTPQMEPVPSRVHAKVDRKHHIWEYEYWTFEHGSSKMDHRSWIERPVSIELEARNGIWKGSGNEKLDPEASIQ